MEGILYNDLKINKMEQSAVEFIRKEFLEKLTNENYKKSFDEIIDQAKEMEKEQIQNAWEEGFFADRKGENIDAEQN